MKLFIFLSLLSVISATRFLILNDIHLNQTFEGECTFGMCNDLGVYGKDSPLSLVQTIIKRAAADNAENGKPDAVLLLGDHLRHKLDPGDTAHGNGDFTEDDKF